MLHGCFFEGSQFHFVLLDAQLLELDGCEEHVLLPAKDRRSDSKAVKPDKAECIWWYERKTTAVGGWLCCWSCCAL
jgi:hypothetical protein